MLWLALDDLDCETVEALFRQAVITHPRKPGSDSHVRAGILEFSALIKAELEGRLNERRLRERRPSSLRTHPQISGPALIPAAVTPERSGPSCHIACPGRAGALVPPEQRACPSTPPLI